MPKHRKYPGLKPEKPTVKIELAFYALMVAIYAGIITVLAIIGSHTAQMAQMLELILHYLL